MKDCRNCAHGRYNDHFHTWFCYHNCECNDWGLWESTDAEQPKKYPWEAIPCEEHFKMSYEDEKTISTRPHGEWIPCSERLPSDSNDYLVVDGDGEMAVGYYRDDTDAWDNSCFGWLEREDEDEHPTRLGKVVAWMPLPIPYKGGDD